MDNLQSIGTKNYIPPEQQDGQAQNVLGATQRVLEVMEESKHTVISSQNILKHEKENLYQLFKEVENLKYSINQNIAHLESNNTMKKTIEEYNEKFLSSAQMIYLSGQELNNDLNSIGNEFANIDDKLAMNTTKYELTVKNNETVERELIISLEELEKQNLEYVRKRNDEENQNRELQHDLDEINKKLQFYEEKICNTDVNALSEENASYEKNIGMLNNDISLLDSKLRMLSESLEEMKRKKLNAEEEAKTKIVELDHTHEEQAKQLSFKNCQLTEMKNKYSELCSKIVDLEAALSLKSEKCAEYTTNLRELETQLSQMEENHKREIADCEKLILEKDGILNDEKLLSMELSKTMNNIDTKIDIIGMELTDLQTCIKDLENKPDDNLRQQLEAKQIELEQIKSSKRDLKELLKNLESERATKVNSEQREIEELERNNKKLMDDNNCAESEITRVRGEIERIEKQNLENEKYLMKLDSEMKMIEAQIESEENSAKHNFVQPMKRASSVTGHIRNKTVETTRNWDSDSSLEGEIKTFSKRARMKTKMVKKGISK